MKNTKLITLITLVTLIVMISNVIVTMNQFKDFQNKVNLVIANIVGIIREKYPEINEEEVISILNMKENSLTTGYNILEKYGINTDEIYAIDGMEKQEKDTIVTNIISIIILFVIIIIILFINSKIRKRNIQSIIKYIEELNKKNYNLQIEKNSEDELSNLSNELYKITVMLKEQAEASLKDKKALQNSLEDISHQLKTPLTSISIMLDNIRENPNMDEHTKQKFIYEINRQIEWINWLVISLLKLSKLDSNTVTFVKRKIEVKKLIKNVIQNLAIPLDIKQQKIIVNGKSLIETIDYNESKILNNKLESSEKEKNTTTDVKFIGDYNWELEAITNIIKNCIEHTPENKNIYINFEENNFYTKITIKDEGVGIDKEDIKHIFERFYKGKNSSENSVGIGLALAKSIIEKDNGYILCFSKKEEGTTFEIKYMK